MKPSLCLSCWLGLLASSALAQEVKPTETPAPTPTPESVSSPVSPVSSANFLAHVVSRFYVLDTTTNGLPDFRFDVVEFGISGKVGLPTYEIRAKLNSNGLGLGLQRANVGLLLPTGTAIQMGRVNVFFDQDFETDGLRLWQPLEIGDVKINLGAAMGNTKVLDTDALGKRDNDGYYYGLFGEVKAMGFKLGTKYGAEPKRVSSLPTGSTPGTMFGWSKLVTFGGYVQPGWDLCGSFTMEENTKQVNAKVENRKWTKDTDVAGSKATSHKEMNVAGNVNSTLLDMTGFVQQGDKLLTGFSFVNKGENYEKTTKDNKSEKFKANYLEVYVGYNVNNFTAKLYYNVESSDQKWYANDKNTAGKKSKQQAYLNFDYLH